MRILGIDYGHKRMGTAFSDPSGTFATPHQVLDVVSDTDALKQMGELCAEEEVDRIVIGLPLNMNGTEGPMAEKVLAFTKRLSEELRLPVETWDERLSSYAAERVLIEADVSREERKKVLDKMAAQVILQSYLDSRNLTPET